MSYAQISIRLSFLAGSVASCLFERVFKTSFPPSPFGGLGEAWLGMAEREISKKVDKVR